MQTFNLGTASSRPGSIQYGRFDALTHPTGHTEFFPVIVAQGKEEGPCLWLTSGLHGDEPSAPVVIYRLLNQILVEQLRGTIIAIPALNPAGLRIRKRESYHTSDDPNRLWPGGKTKRAVNPDNDPPSALEAAYARVFEHILSSANYMIDFHCTWPRWLSFGFKDRILYHSEDEQSKAKAEALSARQMEMLRAYGHTIIREEPAGGYVEKDLLRSISAAVLMQGGIPAITVELGDPEIPDPAAVAAAVAGTRNIMRWAGMLPGEMESIQGIAVIDPGFPVQWRFTLRAPQAGVVLHLVKPGDQVKVGDRLAEMRDVWGQPIGDGYLYSEYDGFVIGHPGGVYYYPGESTCCLAVRDETPLVAPYPVGYL